MKDNGLLWFIKYVFRKISKVATSSNLLGYFQPFAQCAINHKNMYYSKIQYKLLRNSNNSVLKISFHCGENHFYTKMAN